MSTPHPPPVPARPGRQAKATPLARSARPSACTCSASASGASSMSGGPPARRGSRVRRGDAERLRVGLAATRHMWSGVCGAVHGTIRARARGRETRRDGGVTGVSSSRYRVQLGTAVYLVMDHPSRTCASLKSVNLASGLSSTGGGETVSAAHDPTEGAATAMPGPSISRPSSSARRALPERHEWKR
ncbi:hypothetical protein BJY52DRAFT_1225186 [Lactarius psammicola]|nr:hypothetical protein BJY52DRAFT_1225186 [Lactarius psammicola]